MLSDVPNFTIFKYAFDYICYPMALNYPLKYAKRPGNIIARLAATYTTPV